MKQPATRELARQLGVNRGTVALAYEELVATGWARAHVGQGTFVAERPQSGGAPAVPATVQPVALDWSGLFSRSAQNLGADDERSRAVTPIPSSGAVVSFAGGMQVFRSFGAQLLSVPWDGTGPRAEIFERLLERHTPKLFYCQPSAHNPTGLAVAPETARRLLEVAARHQVPIVEDGFDGSL